MSEFEKGREFPVGTIRTWGDIKYRKELKGWVAVTESGGERKDEPAVKEQIKSIVSSQGSGSSKIKALIALGLTDKKDLAALSGAHYSQAHSLLAKHFDQLESSDDTSPTASLEDLGLSAESLGIELPQPSVDERWESYSLFADMVVKGQRRSMVAYGTGGVGKTFTLNKVLEKNNLVAYQEPSYEAVEQSPDEDSDVEAVEQSPDEDSDVEGDEEGDFIPYVEVPYDFIKITGKATPTAVYQALYEHNGKILVFDDCDAVLEKDDAINILKGALDTTGDGTISYGGKAIKTNKPVPGKSPDKTGRYTVPPRFTFNGQVIFISNLTKDKMPQPIRSRALCIDLTMTKQETLDRMRKIAPDMTFQDNKGNKVELDTEHLSAAIDFLQEFQSRLHIDNFNARTLGSIALVKQAVSQKNESEGTNIDWRKTAINLVV